MYDQHLSIWKKLNQTFNQPHITFTNKKNEVILKTFFAVV
jgi:hypothetical protein